ncbi:DUF6379 domain-containing protein [Chitinophagaceae bacterium LB-8]|uniref:C-deglycosylation enzyme beta subunit n=1 Tax=Paraflavisolibacter caeni TaxID=2982496 RepID=A0A9X3B8H1_9BACT|nr:DUF6379 domain-containing protein [Paraflavisolibacter caeni]MCU7549771.1 DUF6379 domain-containing protein [Paraflavisolibacter caeni]
MPTKFLKLGFDDRVLCERSFRNIYLNGNRVGFNLGVNLNYYRGLHVSCIERLEVKVNGETIPEYLILFCINGKKFSVSQLKDLFAEFWSIKNTAHLEIYNYGLPEGKHDIALTLELRIPYMKFAPRTYGAVDSSAHKKMTILN